MPVVVFNFANFTAMYPEFAAVGEPAMQTYFDLSDQFFKNDGTNPALLTGIDRMTRLAYMVTAHLAYLLSPRNSTGAPSSTGVPNQTVGQITSASEGSVSVSFKDVASAAGGNDTEAFWAQTKYGLMYWVATGQFRLGHYFANQTLTPLSVYPTRPYPRRGGW